MERRLPRRHTEWDEPPEEGTPAQAICSQSGNIDSDASRARGCRVATLWARLPSHLSCVPAFERWRG